MSLLVQPTLKQAPLPLNHLSSHWLPLTNKQCEQLVCGTAVLVRCVLDDHIQKICSHCLECRVIEQPVDMLNLHPPLKDYRHNRAEGSAGSALIQAVIIGIEFCYALC